MKSVNAVTIKELYDLSHTEAKPLMEQYTYPWEVLPHIGEFIVKLGESLPKEEYTEVAEHVWVHKTAKVFASAYLALTGNHRRRDRSAPVCVCPRKCAGWKRLCDR